MESKIGIMLDLPDDKLPGFYAQLVKALAGKAQLFDRDKEMLIVSSDDQQQAVLDIMAHYKVETEIMALCLVPDDAELADLFSDYGFISRSEHAYLYESLIRVFRLVPANERADIASAKQQMDEHVLAQWSTDGHETFVVDRQLEELMHGIAKAYRCQIDVQL